MRCSWQGSTISERRIHCYATKTRELFRDPESELLFNHSARVYHFVESSQGFAAGWCSTVNCCRPAQCFTTWDLHQNTLVRPERRQRGSRFLRARKISQSEIDLVWTAIALHTTPGIPVHMHPIVALVRGGEMDVLGIVYESSRTRNASK